MTTLETIQALAMQGIGKDGIEATIGHELDKTEFAAFHKAKTARRIRRAAEAKAEKKRKREEAERRGRENLAGWLEGTSWQKDNPDASARDLPLTATERSRLFRAKGRELGELPKPADPWRRNMIWRYSLLAFGLDCFQEGGEGMAPILKHPPSPRMRKFIQALQTTIVFGGLKHIRWPRGKGKTTWIKIAIIWVSLYGYKRFSVVIGKVKSAAKEIVDEVWLRICRSPRIVENFPEFAVPMRDVAFAPQRMRSQTCGGEPTRMKVDLVAGYIRLPTIKNMPHTGAIICWRGADQAIRGLNIESVRPDFIFSDDPQDDETARNPARVDKIEDSITGSVLGTGDTSQRISGVMASTPIEPEDVSERFADPKLHPEWMTETEPFVISWGPMHLVDKYIDLLAADENAGDQMHTSAQAFYAANRAEIEAGSEMLDPMDFDPKTEMSAYQHALWLLHSMKRRRFFSEMQMETTVGESLVVVTPDLVRSRARTDRPPFFVPEDSVLTAAAADLNPSYGFSYVIGAENRLAAAHLPWYGIHKTSIHRERMSEAEYRSAVYTELVAFAKKLAEDCAERGIELEALCLDAGGEQSEPVMWLYKNRKALGIPFPIVPMYGRAGKAWRPFNKLNVRAPINETVERAADGRRWIVFNADYWRETMQRSWLAVPGAPGALTLFGDPRFNHRDYAAQVTAEKLKSKRETPDGGWKYVWTGGEIYRHDLGDATTMFLAYAGSRGITQGATSKPPKTKTEKRRSRAIVGGNII